MAAAAWFDLVPVSAGIHMAALGKQPIDMDMLLKLARRVDVGLYTLEGFYHASVPLQGLMLGYGAIDSADIDPSLDRLRDILTQMG